MMEIDISKRLEKNIEGTSHVKSDETSSLLLSRHLFAYHCATRFLPSNGTVLEVGPGDGYGIKHLSTKSMDICAVDISMSSLQKINDDGKLVCGDGGQLPFKSNCFDGVVSFQILEHHPEPETFLKELIRVTRPESKVLLTTPNRKHRLLPGQKPWNPHHITEYSRKDLEELLEGHAPSHELYGINASERVRKMEFDRLPGKTENLLKVYGLPNLVSNRFTRQVKETIYSQRESVKVPQENQRKVFPEEFVLERMASSGPLDFFVVIEAG